jgi:hypothetical protein
VRECYCSCYSGPQPGEISAPGQEPSNDNDFEGHRRSSDQKLFRMSSSACWIHYLYGQLQRLLGIAGDGTGAGLQGRDVGAGSVQTQLVEVVLKNPKQIWPWSEMGTKSGKTV